VRRICAIAAALAQAAALPQAAAASLSVCPRAQSIALSQAVALPQAAAAAAAPVPLCGSSRCEIRWTSRESAPGRCVPVCSVPTLN
jgi:hypothetical protein